MGGLGGGAGCGSSRWAARRSGGRSPARQQAALRSAGQPTHCCLLSRGLGCCMVQQGTAARAGPSRSKTRRLATVQTL